MACVNTQNQSNTMTDTRQSSQKANASAAGFGVVILAGGQGTRMGLDKSQLVLGNQTFLERIIESAQQVTRHVVVVGAHGQVRPSRMNGLSQSSQHAVIWASDQQPETAMAVGAMAVAAPALKMAVVVVVAAIPAVAVEMMALHLPTTAAAAVASSTTLL